MNKLREIIYNDIISDFKIPQNKKILIFEDIDCMSNIVKERDSEEQKNFKEKIKENSSLLGENKLEELLQRDINYNNNLSYFLNIIDGLQECPGRIIIMTTNKPQELDKALIRPGRIDYNIHFTLATHKDIKDIIEFYWDQKIDNILDSIDNKLSHAEVVNMCRISNSINETISKIIN
jgi:chaperone BCS1